MEKILNKLDKRNRESDKASAIGGVKKIFGWIIWALAKVFAFFQVELTALDGSMPKAEGPKTVYRDMKDSKMSDTNREIAKIEKLVAKAEPRLAKAIEEGKINKALRYTELLEGYEDTLVQLDRVQRALRK